MDMNQAASAGNTASRTARFAHAPVAADYGRALWRYTLGTRPGRTAMLVLPVVLGAAAGGLRVAVWGLGTSGYVTLGVTLLIAPLGIRQWHRRFRMNRLYEADAARGAVRTVLTEDGLTVTGAGADGADAADEVTDWRGYPWWFETDELFVLTGSLEHFFVLPKRGALSPEDVDGARALFTEHLRRI
ncbi:YcxB family protein [Streptomyces sp. NPDC059917]|uniref:YcxB family protein n=1 Tax=Streptomyces sp. NPDC059917 TaxID=3347002 RepID=UPI00364933C3